MEKCKQMICRHMHKTFHPTTTISRIDSSFCDVRLRLVKTKCQLRILEDS
jgi:hypothetical protein